MELPSIAKKDISSDVIRPRLTNTAYCKEKLLLWECKMKEKNVESESNVMAGFDRKRSVMSYLLSVKIGDDVGFSCISSALYKNRAQVLFIPLQSNSSCQYTTVPWMNESGATFVWNKIKSDVNYSNQMVIDPTDVHMASRRKCIILIKVLVICFITWLL